jgi:hypothetical protein
LTLRRHVKTETEIATRGHTETHFRQAGDKQKTTPISRQPP